MRHRHHGRKAKAARVSAAGNPDKNLPIKVSTRNLNRQDGNSVASAGIAKPHTVTSPGPNRTDEKRVISLCHWTQAHLRHPLRSYRSLS